MYLILVVFIAIALVIRLVYSQNTSDTWMHSYCLDTRCYSNKRHRRCACNLSSQVSYFRSTPHTSSFSFLEILSYQKMFLRLRLRLLWLAGVQETWCERTILPYTTEIHHVHSAYERNLLSTMAWKISRSSFCCASDKTQLGVPTCSSCSCHFSCTSTHFL